MKQVPTSLIAGNWKMNGVRASLKELEALGAFVDEAQIGCDVALCLPATLIGFAGDNAGSGKIALGGQDCHAAVSGAHTGDVSAEMLQDAGARYVIVGHSERRADHGETDQDVRAKTEAAFSTGLVPIICVGELEAERRAGQALSVVEGQLAASIPDSASDNIFVVAYEPVWAIGTGLTPTIEDIAQMHAALRARLVARFGTHGETVALLYGGSMKPGNAAEILAVADVNGGLVGGASLKADDFITIIKAASS